MRFRAFCDIESFGMTRFVQGYSIGRILMQPHVLFQAAIVLRKDVLANGLAAIDFRVRLV